MTTIVTIWDDSLEKDIDGHTGQSLGIFGKEQSVTVPAIDPTVYNRIPPRQAPQALLNLGL